MTRLKRNILLLNKKRTISRVSKELDQGLSMLNSIDTKIVSVFGSHITKMNHKDYIHCKKLAYALGKEGYGIVTGGGPGIMHAANAGASKAKAPSIGVRAALINNEKVYDDVYTHIVSMDFLFVRRFILALKSEALIFYPGGYGTLNELFEYVVLIETGLVDRVPLICVNKKYWEGLFKWLKGSVLGEGFLPHKLRDINLLHVTDDINQIVNIIKNEK